LRFECLSNQELTTDLLLLLYCNALFPMGSEESDEIHFYQPSQRCLFPITGIRVSKSLKKTIRSGQFFVTFDQAFEEVMRGCLRPKGENWITERIIRVYCQAHEEGWGHSCEVWSNGSLVGGVYGLAIGSAFFAESMFHRQTDASKVALHSLIEHCRHLGFSLFDAQIMNPHLASLGAYEISLEEYHSELNKSIMIDTDWGLALDKNHDFR
jgi:leucyl/phenylalanyl-tRNA---protein transferase